MQVAEHNYRGFLITTHDTGGRRMGREKTYRIHWDRTWAVHWTLKGAKQAIDVALDGPPLSDEHAEKIVAMLGLTTGKGN